MSQAEPSSSMRLSSTYTTFSELPGDRQSSKAFWQGGASVPRPAATPTIHEHIQVARTHFEEFSRYLMQLPAREAPNHRSTVWQKSIRLITHQQCAELSTDVYDEILRRRNESENPNTVPFLPVQVGFRPERNQARAKLASLPVTELQDLSSDVHHELLRRNPEIGRHVLVPILDPRPQSPGAYNEHYPLRKDVASRRPNLIVDSVLAGKALPTNINLTHAANVLQKWLDDNTYNRHRHLIIKKLIGFASEYNHVLPSAIFISGVYVNGDAVPIAGGSFSDVFKGRYKEQDVAVKQFRVFMSGERKEKSYKRLYREAVVWRQLRHPRVVPFLGIDGDALRWNGSLNMVSPWMVHGTLMEYLEQIGFFPVPHKELIMDIASGLEYLHSQTFAHGDLHGSNVFIDGEGCTLLGDFGLTAVTDMAHLAPTTTVNKAGAIRWLAPELVHYEDGPPPRKTMSGDIFAFGRICFSVYTRSVPFYPISSDAGIVMKVMMHQHPDKPTLNQCHGATLPDDMWDLMNQCWTPSADARPCIADIILCLDGINF